MPMFPPNHPERLQLAAAAGVTAVEPVVRGQLIVREGELVTPRAFSMLKAMGAGGVEPAAVPSSLLWMIPIATGMAILVLWWRLGRRRLAGPSEAVVIVDDELPGVGRGAMAPSREELLALLREEFVGALVEQRRTMLNAQQRAHDELERLENRLSDLQVPLRSRLDAYEARIADLERELHRRGDENRELFQATIELMQQKVEQEKAGRPVNFN